MRDVLQGVIPVIPKSNMNFVEAAPPDLRGRNVGSKSPAKISLFSEKTMEDDGTSAALEIEVGNETDKRVLNELHSEQTRMLHLEAIAASALMACPCMESSYRNENFDALCENAANVLLKLSEMDLISESRIQRTTVAEFREDVTAEIRFASAAFRSRLEMSESGSTKIALMESVIKTASDVFKKDFRKAVVSKTENVTGIVNKRVKSVIAKEREAAVENKKRLASESLGIGSVLGESGHKVETTYQRVLVETVKVHTTGKPLSESSKIRSEDYAAEACVFITLGEMCSVLGIVNEGVGAEDLCLAMLQ